MAKEAKNLFRILRSKDCELSEIKRVVKKIVNLNAVDPGTNSFLHYALMNPSCKLGVIKELLHYGADVNFKGADFNSPLHLAARNLQDDWRIMHELLINGANPKATNILGYTPLHFAARGNSEIRTYSWQSLENSNSEPPPKKMKELETWEKHYGIRQLLNERAESLQHLALRHEKNSCPWELDTKSTELNTVNLQSGTRKRSLNSGAISKATNRKNTQDCSFLHSPSAAPRKADAIRWLLKHGANVNASETICKSTPLHLAVSVQKCNLQEIRMLLKNGADINALDIWRLSPLHYAMINNMAEADVTLELLNDCDDVNLKGPKGYTMLHFALLNEKPKLKVIKKLLDRKAEVSTRTESGISPISFVVDIANYGGLDLLEDFFKQSSLLDSGNNNYCDPSWLIFWLLELKTSDDLQSVASFEKAMRLFKLSYKYTLLGARAKDSLEYYREVLDLCIPELDFLEDCDFQYREMKQYAIINGLSFYHLFFDEQIATELCRIVNQEWETVLGILDSNVFNLFNEAVIEKIPSSLIFNKLKKTIIYSKADESSQTKVHLNIDCIHKLAYYFSKGDMINLVIAYSDISEITSSVRQQFEVQI